MAMDAAGWRARAEATRAQLAAAREAERVELPVRWWRQAAHLTVPASDLAMATKAVEGGLGAAEKLLAKYGIDRDALASALSVSRGEVDAALDAGERRSPLVMLDGEDAQAADEATFRAGRAHAVKLFRDAAWGRTLRMWRPAGIGLPSCVDDLADVLLGAGADREPADFPIDGVTWPKASHPDELAWLCERLDGVEDLLGLQRNRVRVQFLVESGWAVERLEALVAACRPRLSGVVYGIADHAADVGLPEVRNDHPVADDARIRIVNVAGAADVPAIDSMTVRYPVADRTLDAAANRARILERMRECFDDARHGFALGFAGKWVGHPLQLVAVLVAERAALPEARIALEISRVEAYAAASAVGRGATIIGEAMNDRAHDRHARRLLRRAVATGRLAAERAVALGIVSSQEASALA
jgi:citrate lyase beta subunit